jgi:hypothetical protein
MTVVAIAGWVVRLTGMAQVVLGLLFWVGHALPLVGAHMLNGMVFVLGVLVLVVAAARSGLGAPLAALATGYTLVVPAFGMTHARILPGPAHWVVEVAHLLVGLGAMILAARLGGFVRRRGIGAVAAPSWRRSCGPSSPRLSRAASRTSDRRTAPS